jgi:hypothetical protein
METTEDLSGQCYQRKATEKHERGRTKKEKLTGVRAAAVERRRDPRRRLNFPRYSAEEERRRRYHRRRCRTSSSIGASAGSLFSRSGGGAQGTEELRKKTMAWGKKERSYPHRPIYTSPGKGRGGGSAPLPDRFCVKSPRGGVEWGGGSYNRATMQ